MGEKNLKKTQIDSQMSSDLELTMLSVYVYLGQNELLYAK